MTVFDAFATPAGTASPPGTQLLPGTTDGVPLRYPAVGPAWVGALCEDLREARPALADRDAVDLAAVLGRVGERFLDPSDPLRQESLELLPSTAGISPEMALAVLDGMAADWTGARLARLLEIELGDAASLDGFVRFQGRRAMARGPTLCFQVVAGSVPGVGVNALLRSLLVKGPTLLKPGRGDVVLPVLFARALGEADRALAAALAVVYWPGGSAELEEAALDRADVVTAYGSDATVDDLRARSPVTARFVGYHHRVSVGVVGRDALSGAGVETTAAEVARSLALFDQRGCVSPQLVYVEEGGELSPGEFAEALAAALDALEGTLPTGPLDVAEAAALHQARGTAELTEAGGGRRILHGGSAAWTVLLETASATPVPSVGRIARVRPLAVLGSLPELLAPLSGHLQTVGVAGLGDRLEAVARDVGRVGASRVVPFTAVPFPSPWWHHDGGGPLVDLVRWVDLEAE